MEKLMPYQHRFVPDPRIQRNQWPLLVRRIAFTIMLGLIAAGTIILLGWGVIRIPQEVLNPKGAISAADRLKAENDLRATIIQALAGIAIVVGLYLTRRTILVTREGQITDRFSRAIDQLGSDRLDIRLGALYALERVMHDSRVDNTRVMQVLISFIRSRRSLPEDQEGQERELQPVETDVQVDLTIITSRPRANEDRFRLQLAELDLSAASLELGNFDYANFSYCRLDRCIFTESGLNSALFMASSLRNAGLVRTDLRNARLQHADLRNAYLSGSDLRGANLSSANLSKADLGGRRTASGRYRTRPAQLDGAYLANAKLTGTVLTDVDLSKVRGLTQDQLNEAIIEGDAKLPRGLHRPDITPSMHHDETHQNEKEKPQERA
jgi:uncharacterized protein YjbI with pentapeptide repeats